MKIAFEQVKNINLSVQPQNSTKRNKKRIFVIFTVFVLFVLACLTLYIMQSQNNNTKSALNPSASKLSVTPKAKSIYKTSETQIATSLEPPPLYPGASWKEEVNSSDSFFIHEIYAETKDDYKSVTVPFPEGRFWKTTIPGIEFNSIETYYYEQLEKKSWFGQGGLGSLKFDDFTLSLVADGACGGIVGYIGYKDEMVRLVSIHRETRPCDQPMGSKEVAIRENYTTYYLFISNLTPIDKIAEYIKTRKSK